MTASLMRLDHIVPFTRRHKKGLRDFLLTSPVPMAKDPYVAEVFTLFLMDEIIQPVTTPEKTPVSSRTSLSWHSDIIAKHFRVVIGQNGMNMAS
ncbi:hypothetical protein EYZ11_012570 [Aspergillus tanneri]|uniref:Uncharacterized protein n=1 Tax=Aspergillus tanneri TaxID=1220188 RepID=A0A4S3IZX3_9EURO|nr:uncharacterized protein ATNIH1004_005802 [Aspergillus tanneri]KAA8647119.1 hypothetical protein ATNIH1004_005802 [Aspergillus tanneri]THC87983.1 hypothetical protein EYZ11_012570 [Aspergillus tanneri]